MQPTPIRITRSRLSRQLPALAALAVVLSILMLGSTSPAKALLSYTLASELKKSGCASDTDADCLDNSEETNLGWAVSPWYFYDEDEGCSGWTNRWGLPSYHFARVDFFQVRPQGSGISSWSPTDGIAKWVRITYFLNYPHDCASHFGFAGHQGDSESVRFHLYSYNLRTWYLSYAYYWHHGRIDYVSGSFLQSKAQDLGTSWASIAADQNSHGSWPGKEVSSSHCAGSMDDFCLSTCDCFINTWQWDYNNGYLEYPPATRNVGGPSPENWNGAVLTISGSDAYSLYDVGHGLNREYWTPRTDQYKWFCGWECNAVYRQSDGHCAVNVHDRSNCAEGPLSSKVDTVYFDVGSGLAAASSPAGSCAGSCGGHAGSCWCDDTCAEAGDCCPDVAVCGDRGSVVVPGKWAWKSLSRTAAFDQETIAAAQRGAALAEDAIRRLKRQVRRLGPGVDQRQEQLRLRRLAGDAISAVLPMLAEATPQEQLRTLRWMRTVSDHRRLVVLFPDLVPSDGAPDVASELVAGDRLDWLAALLVVNGYEVPELAPELTVDEIDDHAPAPNSAPNSLIEELAELFPFDPEVEAFLRQLQP